MSNLVTAASTRQSSIAGLSPAALELREELTSRSMKELERCELGGLSIDIHAGRDALWAIVRRPRRGGFALRASHASGNIRSVERERAPPGAALQLRADGAVGRSRFRLSLIDGEAPLIRATISLTATAPLLIPFLPRDVYPLDDDDDPASASGSVEAGQRGMNTGLCYVRLTEPDGAVGGEWPELGYLPPTPPHSGTPPINPLPANSEVAISDALIACDPDSSGDERTSARRYLALLGAIYPRLDRPESEYRDWVGRAERTIADLGRSPKATIRHYGFRYAHPYTAAEYPNSMVQTSLVSALRDFEVWQGGPVPLRAEMAKGLSKFYDPGLGTLRRYLPNVGAEKNKYAVDSWYLYHPLINLGRLANDGDRRAYRLLVKSLDYAIRAAHHFDYKWPIQYDVRNFAVLQKARDDAGLGQTDVGGIYAYVMLQAFELTDDKRFLDEARAALDAATGMRFELNYQANLTAWGAAACQRWWRITNARTYFDQGYVYLAGFFHSTTMWESEIGHAVHYRNFLGATALHDSPYMAIYECFDSFRAFEFYLKDSGPDLDPAVRLLVSEYCRYALDRAWFYYPDALPADALAAENRNGHIDRELSFPLEDLYVDGQCAGQVGQEIYGAGAAMVFAARSFHIVTDTHFRIYCDHFLLASDRSGERSLSFQLGGAVGFEAILALVATTRARLPAFKVSILDGTVVQPRHRHRNRTEYRVPANARVIVSW